MIVHQQFSLKDYNTFGIRASCKYFISIENESEFPDALNQAKGSKLPFMFLGGGSNVLFTSDFDGYILHINTKGINLVNEDIEYVWIEAAAGEPWDNLINYCIDHNYFGLENLSGIPGKVGSSPIQNIGAYGVEVKDYISEVKIIYTEDLRKGVLHASDCNFGYRDSIFKNQLKNRALIEKVTFRLKKKPGYFLEYKGVMDELKNISSGELSLKAVSQAIINIRNRKIPRPEELGSAGSFFKNPVIAKQDFTAIFKAFPDLSYYNQDGDKYKLSAAWLIDQCGWKGYRIGDAGVNGNQPLILVNYQNASGNDIKQLAGQIVESVFFKFGVRLEAEVNII